MLRPCYVSLIAGTTYHTWQACWTVTVGHSMGARIAQQGKLPIHLSHISPPVVYLLHVDQSGCHVCWSGSHTISWGMSRDIVAWETGLPFSSFPWPVAAFPLYTCTLLLIPALQYHQESQSDLMASISLETQPPPYLVGIWRAEMLMESHQLGCQQIILVTFDRLWRGNVD